MTRPRCQICGRRRGLNKAGTLLAHYVGGEPCLGAGFPPIEEDDARLAAVIEGLRDKAARRRAFVRDLLARRVNYIDPAIEDAARKAEDRADQLDRRLRRHRSWPARFAREMERQGWGSPPPAYLLSRETVTVEGVS